MTRYPHAPRGFTIAEILVVVAAFGVVSLATVPIAGRIVAHHRLQAATRQMAFEVGRARMQAIGQNVFVRIVPLGDGWYARERSEDGVAWAADGEALELPRDIELLAGSTGLPTFNRQGLAPARTTLTVRGPAGERTLAVSVIGRVRVERAEWSG